MKIKCPFCDEVVNTKHMSLYDHWCDVHDADEICIAHSKLLEKIHEKIEDVETSITNYDEVKKQFGEIVMNYTKGELNIILQELKSLLEYEK